jgi:hypothetical protein
MPSTFWSVSRPAQGRDGLVRAGWVAFRQVVVACAVAVLLRAFVHAVRTVPALFRLRRRTVPHLKPSAPTLLLRGGTDHLIGARRRAPPTPSSLLRGRPRRRDREQNTRSFK